MILYESTHQAHHYKLGTSGFLYRSDKLMYDQATQSLWNTLQGRPVIGPLVDKKIQLKRRSVVTTTWGEWRRRYPQTTVLSLDTGFRRDYGEGVAYREYFATDRLMFNVSVTDPRLKNKDQVLGLVFGDDLGESLAIHVDYLKHNPVYHGELSDQRFVVLTDPSGAARVYESPDAEGADWKVVEWDGDRKARDEHGVEWTLYENRLESNDGQKLKRLPQHRAFWFGWFAAFPKTRLIQ